MMSRTKIKFRKRKKTNTELVETIELALRSPAWGKVAMILAGPKSNYSTINLKEIDEKTSAGDTVVILGKVLSVGEIKKKIRICAISFSKNAEEKIKKSKGEAVSVLEEIKKNAKAEGIKIIR
ncbi:50S ribosomal protein L18e [Candidatus Pacearchaeota archaeon CG_4_9_14_0_2_um_filter_39_13]|nr:50S ribosomal protein L18e [Candidatus Pacearchaeota archaeon]PJC44921.1 MAG: 50S ribosomal protein L18e [Candidatus Pacearchaeota archaeon CG_4_9_14_0_2_um_filter_39_13]